ncbi:MAG: GtrA family protein [Alistipes sp.]|jgi:putative flippase GtrA|nr:GtrA family protein [Alistipes sp.]
MTTTQRLTSFIDSFYWRPFHGLVSRQAFRYVACGGINWVATTVCFWVAFNFVFAKRDVDLGPTVVAAHTAALAIAWLLSVLLGFWMQKNISFRSSPLRGHTQLFRYFLSAVATLLISWQLENLFVRVCHIYPTVAFTIIYLTTAVVGFAVQRHFTFRGSSRD